MVLSHPIPFLLILLHSRLLSGEHLHHQHSDRRSRPPRRPLSRHPPSIPPTHHSSLLPHRAVPSPKSLSSHSITRKCTEQCTEQRTEQHTEQLTDTLAHHTPREGILHPNCHIRQQRVVSLPTHAPSHRTLRCFHNRFLDSHARRGGPTGVAGRLTALGTPRGVPAARRCWSLSTRVLRVLHAAADRLLQPRRYGHSPSP